MQYQPFVFVAAAHFDHEEEEAELVEAQALLYLLLAQILRRHPLVHFAPHVAFVHLVSFVIDGGFTLSNLAKGADVHLLVLEGPAERAAREGRPTLAVLDLLVQPPVLHPQVILLQSPHRLLAAVRPVVVAVLGRGIELLKRLVYRVARLQVKTERLLHYLFGQSRAEHVFVRMVDRLLIFWIERVVKARIRQLLMRRSGLVKVFDRARVTTELLTDLVGEAEGRVSHVFRILLHHRTLVTSLQTSFLEGICAKVELFVDVLAHT